MSASIEDKKYYYGWLQNVCTCVSIYVRAKPLLILVFSLIIYYDMIEYPILRNIVLIFLFCLFDFIIPIEMKT